jgi:RNA polymerase sigma-70 factor (ECF subfamily)
VTHAGDAVALLVRDEGTRVLATLVRVTGSVDLAEDAVQDAVVRALETWPRDGVPGNPRGWLLVAARRRVVDVIRREAKRLGKEVDAMPAVDPCPDPVAVRDDLLRLVFTCCHPALSVPAQVALTLRLVCGLTTGEIAAAFLSTEPTIAARVTRAKKKISAARIAYRVPEPAELPDRLDSVLVVVHLLFTTGHTAPAGDSLVRGDLVDRAIGLARMLRELMPDEREVIGLLALLVLTDARRATRMDETGGVVLLADQDRSRWDRAAIAEGSALVREALRGGRPGRFAVQAAIAALHAEAPSYAETDWRQVLGLYDVLTRVWSSPVVALNRAVALAKVAGPAAALARVDELAEDGRLAGYRYLPVTRADLLRQLGRSEEAVAAYRAALDLAENTAEREFLAARIAELDEADGRGRIGGSGHRQAEAHGGHPDHRPELPAVAAAESGDGATDHGVGPETTGSGEQR